MADTDDRSVADLEDWYEQHVGFFGANMYNMGNAAFWQCEECGSCSDDVAAGREGVEHDGGCICGLLKAFLYGEADSGG